MWKPPSVAGTPSTPGRSVRPSACSRKARSTASMQSASVSIASTSLRVRTRVEGVESGFGALIQQTRQARYDDIAGLVEVLADGRYVVPRVDAGVGRSDTTDVAPERHDLGGPAHVIARDSMRALAADVDAVTREARDDVGRDGGVRLGAGGRDVDGHAAGAGHPPQVFSGDDTLGRSVQAHEQDGLVGHRTTSFGGYLTNTHVG